MADLQWEHQTAGISLWFRKCIEVLNRFVVLPFLIKHLHEILDLNPLKLST